MEVDVGAVALILVGIIIAGFLSTLAALVRGWNQQKQMRLEAELAEHKANRERERELREERRQRLHHAYKRFMLAAQAHINEVDHRKRLKDAGHGSKVEPHTTERDLNDSFQDVLFVANEPTRNAAQKLWAACMMRQTYTASERLTDFFAEAQADLLHEEGMPRTEPTAEANRLILNPVEVDFE